MWKLSPRRWGSVRAANIVMLGAAAPFIGIEYDKIADVIRRIFGRKGEEIVEMNLKALKAGYSVAQSMQKYKMKSMYSLPFLLSLLLL